MINKNTIIEKLFGKFLTPIFDYFYNELKITPISIFLFFGIILTILRFKQYKKNENPDMITKYKITNRKLNIYNLFLAFLGLLFFIIFTILDQIDIMKS